MKPWHLWVSIAAIAGFGFLFSRDSLARLAWQQFRLAGVAAVLNRGDARLAVELGNYYFNGGAYDLERAKRAYGAALALNSETPWAHYQLARIYFIQGNFYEALQEINRELRVNPANLRSHYVKGLIHGYMGRFAEAESDFKRFVEWSPLEWAGYNDLAWIQARLGKFYEIKKTIGQVFERVPNEKTKNPWLWTSLGVAHLNLQEYNEAKDAFLAALDLAKKMSAKDFWDAYPGNDPRMAENAFLQFRAMLHFNLGVVYEKQKEWARARDEYEKYLAFLSSGTLPGRAEVEKKIEGLKKKL